MNNQYFTKHSKRAGLRATILAATLALAVLGFAPGLRAQLISPFMNGDVCISAEASQVFVYDMSGNSRTTPPFTPLIYSPAFSVMTGGMAFDHLTPPNLLIGLPDATATGEVGTVGKFDANGNPAPPFGFGYGGMPFSMAVTQSGNVFVGEQGNDPAGDLIKFNATGTTSTRYVPGPAPVAMGVKWLDVACDQTTVFYTSESRAIKTFNTNGPGTQGPDFVPESSTALVPDTGTPYTGPLEALKVIPNSWQQTNARGQVIVATRDPIQGLLRFADANTIVQNYVRETRPAGVFVGLSFDPTDLTIWTVDIAQSPPEAVEFNVDTGTEVSSFRLIGVVNAEAITIKGERLCGNALPPVSLSGRMTGGGKFPIVGGTATHGFTLRTPANGPNRMTVTWKDSAGKTHKFKLTTLTSAFLSDDPTFSPTPPRAGFDTYTGVGTGEVDGTPGGTANWMFTDKGEPGANDTVSMTIRNSTGTIVMTTPGTVTLTGGNHQAHP